MKPVVDSFWRAAAYCLLPRVIGLSLLPLAAMCAVALLIALFAWQPLLAWMDAALASWWLFAKLGSWLSGVGFGGLLAPLILALLATPVVVLVALIAVATVITPRLVTLVEQRRFPTLERRRGGSLITGALGGIGGSLIALLALLLSIPLWFIPPLVLIVPPLIWGWLTYRVMTYDVLAEHASAEERQSLMRTSRSQLLLMGVVCGYLGAAPSVVWASGLLFMALAPLLLPLAIWIYTLVFAFSALWFAHYTLTALDRLRAQTANAGRVAALAPTVGATPLDILPQR